MTPSKYQIEIYKQYDETNDNLIIQAGAGSGKSTTILKLLERTPKFKKVILTAFNKSIKEELESKVPSFVKVSTIHSLGYSILRSVIRANFKLNERKNFILGRKILDLSNIKSEKDKNIYLFIISRIVDLSRMNLVEEAGKIEDLCLEYGISVMNGEIEDAIKLMSELDKYNRKNDHKEFMIDFVDMLYLPYRLINPVLFPKYNAVFTDELQDLNPLQKYIIENIIAAGGRFIGVGDDRQSIYSFMGANLESFNSFKNGKNTQVLPLSVTYRCSKKVTEFANTIFTGLEAFENNKEGIVRNGTLDEVREGDFLLCRNNLPLIESWIKFIRWGRKATILGKDFGEAIIAVMNKISNYPLFEEGVFQLLEAKKASLKKLGVEKPEFTNNYRSLVEKIDIIKILKKEFGSFESVKAHIEEVFFDADNNSKESEKSLDGKGIVLMTIHKSKGLERNRVFILGYKELLPSKYAETQTEMYQERCLQYVAVTRAKEELVFIKL